MPADLRINKPNVTLFGEGQASVLKPAPNATTDLITVEQSHFRLQDLTLDGNGCPSGASCVVVNGIGQSGVLVLGEYFENVKFTRAPLYGLWVKDAILLRAQNCQFDSNLGSGARVDSPEALPGHTQGGATTTQFIGCSFSFNADRGCWANAVTALLYQGCTFEGNGGGSTAPSDYRGNCIDATSCIQLQVMSCVFRNPATPAPAGSFIALNSCLSSVVDGCYFDGGPIAAKRPKGGVGFNNSAWSRVSNCVGNRLLNQLAWFDLPSRDGVEFGNAEVEQVTAGGWTRIKSDTAGLRLVGMSRRGLSVQSHGDATSYPTDTQVTPGSLLWNAETGQLNSWDGLSWRVIHFAP